VKERIARRVRPHSSSRRRTAVSPRSRERMQSSIASVAVLASGTASASARRRRAVGATARLGGRDNSLRSIHPGVDSVADADRDRAHATRRRRASKLDGMLRHRHDAWSPVARASVDDYDAELARGDDDARRLLDDDRGGGERPIADDVDVRATALLFIFPAIAGLLFGWDIGSTSGALQSLTDPNTAGMDWYALDPFQRGLVVSTSLAGALVASATAALKLGDKLGSRKELQLAALLYAGGALVQGGAISLETLVLGRFTYGLGIGFAMHGAPLYIAETAPTKVRGLLISLKECFIVGGILLGYAGGYLIEGEEGGWRVLLSSSVALSGVLSLGLLKLPDSPRWWLQRGGDANDARAALKILRGDKATPGTIDAEMRAMTAASEKSGVGGVGELLRKKNVRPLFVGLSVVLFQQITGQPSVLYYAEQVFIAAGFDASEGAGVSVILGVFKLVMTGFAVKYVDSVGRRPLLLGGVAAMTLATVALGACSDALATGDPADSLNTARLSVLAIFAYVGAYQVSFGPIAWLLVGEIFPQRVRSAAVGTATLTNFASNYLVALYLPTMIASYGQAGTYYVFSVMGVIALASIYLTVPETKGKSLEEIEAEMTR